MADFVTARWSAELADLSLRVSGGFGRGEVRRRMRAIPMSPAMTWGNTWPSGSAPRTVF